MRLVPPPPDFEAVYLEGGWRAVERVFGVRPNVVNRWKHYVGYDRISRLRKEHIETEGIAEGIAL